MSRLALPPEIPAKLAKNTLYDVLCVGDSFGVDWTVFEAGISDQAKEAQARALEDGMQFSPSSKDVLRKTELAERKRKLAAARTLNAEGAPGPSVQFSIDSVLSRLRLAEDADVRAMHAALNMTEENFDTPSKPKPGRDSDARRLFAAQRLRLLMGAEFYFNRMAEAAPHLLWLLVLSSDPAYTPERLAKGIMGVEARCIMRNSRAFITRHESSAVWGERPDTGVLTDAYAIRIVLEAACRTCRDRHGRQGICAFDLVPEFEVPGVTIGDRVQVIRRCSMPDSHGRPMIHGAVKYVVPRRTLALTFFSSDSDSDSEAEREAEAAAAARALDFTEEELERARSLPRAGQAMAAAFQAAIGEATASASGARAGGSMITAEGLARAMRVAQAQAQAKGKGKGKAAYIDLRFEEEEAGAPAARRDLGEEMEAAAPKAAEEELEAEREMEMEAALAAAADAKASRELEVAEEYAMELEREREREGEPDAELAATFYPLPPSPSLDGAPPPPIEEFSDDEPGDAGPRPPLVSPAARPPRAPRQPRRLRRLLAPERQPLGLQSLPPSQPSQRPPPSVQGTPSPAPSPRRRGARPSPRPPPPSATCPLRPSGPRAGRLSRRAQQRRERERQLLRDQRAEAEADHDDGQASESDGEPPRATRLELARAELAVQPREAPEIDMSKYDDVTTYSKDNKSKKEAAIQDALRLFVKNNRIVRQRPYGPNSPPTFYVELPNLFVYDKVSANRHAGRGTMKEVIQLLAMTFHKTYESNPGSFEFTFSKEVLSGRTRTFVEESLQLEDVCPEMPVIPGFAFACDTHFVVRAPQDSTGSACVLVMTHEEARERYAGYMNTCYIQGRLPAGIEEATETCDWPTCTACCTPSCPTSSSTWRTTAT
eukprot:tig00000262_g23086.t1